ncbi:MAG: class I SAM-dependent methyltransferase, partial [Candidatus Micrarchaeota archaeon]|nr:class I SAM-dependent methyltransferase [Candidatus Micrarchaeota archaeon]
YVDYHQHADAILSLIRKYKQTPSNALLDMACGTGSHAKLLKPHGFAITGVDLSEKMLAVARRKNPDTVFLQGDMRTFVPTQKYGVVLCFHNAILYNQDAAQMRRTLSNFYSSLLPGGILIFDAVDKKIGFTPKRGVFIYDGKDVHLEFRPEWAYNQKQNRMDLTIDFLVDDKTYHDHHEMGAFSFEEITDLLKEAGFDVFAFERNLEAPKPFEGIFVGRKPL